MDKDNTFSGCIMIGFKTMSYNYEWNSILKDLPIDHSLVQEYEHEPHVTIVYGIHRDDIIYKNFVESISKIYKQVQYPRYYDGIELPMSIQIDTNVNMFSNKDKKVVKLDIPNTMLSYCELALFRQYILTQYRYQLTYPNYHAHVTLCYLDPSHNEFTYNIGNFIPPELSIESLNISYRDDDDNLHTQKIMLI